RYLLRAVAVTIMTKESGPQPAQAERAVDTDQAAGAGSQLTDAARLGARHHYDVALDLWYGRKSPESEALDKAAAEHKAFLVNALMSAFTREERAELDNCLAGDGSPLEAAKLLKHKPEIVETWSLPDTEPVRMIRGLVRLSNPDAFALV